MPLDQFPITGHRSPAETARFAFTNSVYCVCVHDPSGLCIMNSYLHYIHIYIYTYIYILIHIYIYIYINTYIYIFICLSIFNYIYLYLSIVIYIYLYLSIFIYIYLYLSISIYIYLYLSIVFVYDPGNLAWYSSKNKQTWYVQVPMPSSSGEG